MFLSSVSAGHLQSRVRCHVYSLCMAFLCLLGTERCALPCLGLIPGWHATTRYLLGLHFTVVLSPASQSFCIVIVVAFMDLCIVLLDVMTITCIAIDLLLSSYLFPFLPLSFLPTPSSSLTSFSSSCILLRKYIYIDIYVYVTVLVFMFCWAAITLKAGKR